MDDKPNEIIGAVRFTLTIRWLSEKLQWISYVGLVVLMIGTTMDVIGRYVFNKPILGVFDATGLIGCVIISFALAKTQVLRGHTSVQILTSRLGQRSKAILNSISWLISFILFVMITWKAFLFARSMHHVGEYTMTVKIPIAPFAYVMTIGCGMLALVLLMDFINSLAQIRRQ